jgi:hypothetical protein
MQSIVFVLIAGLVDLIENGKIYEEICQHQTKLPALVTSLLYHEIMSNGLHRKRMIMNFEIVRNQTRLRILDGILIIERPFARLR